MVILERQQQVLLIFGLGLIGSSIKNALHADHCHHFPFSWENTTQQSEELSSIGKFLEEHASLPHVEVIWTAGKGGFSSPDHAFPSEYQALEQVLHWTKNLRKTRPVNFHLFSSAGGLFEGQILVDQDSTPQPLRPYGHWKMKQERLAMDLLENSMLHIYRPSTVYGYQAGARTGLIANLLQKGKSNTFVEIFASKSALRDYIYVEDIAQFLVHQLENNTAAKPAQIHFLVSGKSSNILEICQLASEILNKPILSSYRLNLENTADNTFSPKLKPSGLFTRSLMEGMRGMVGKINQ